MIKNKTKVLECLNFGTYILFPDLQISLDPETAKKKKMERRVCSVVGVVGYFFLEAARELQVSVSL